VKKLSAILLLAIFFFNLFGYRILFNYVQQQADVSMEASLDNNDFNEAELITITVPLSVPYQNSQQNFERVDGELKVNGKIYKYVKRKITDGQLILKCLPDHQKMLLQSAKDDFFKYANDLVQNNQSKKSGNSKSGIFKNTVAEYDCFTTNVTANPVGSDNLSGIPAYQEFFPSSPSSTPDRPPEFL